MTGEVGTDDVLYLLASNHVLARIEDEFLGTLTLLQMGLGVLEDKTKEKYFFD